MTACTGRIDSKHIVISVYHLNRAIANVPLILLCLRLHRGARSLSLLVQDARELAALGAVRNETHLRLRIVHGVVVDTVLVKVSTDRGQLTITTLDTTSQAVVEHLHIFGRFALCQLLCLFHHFVYLHLDTLTR